MIKCSTGQCTCVNVSQASDPPLYSHFNPPQQQQRSQPSLTTILVAPGLEKRGEDTRHPPFKTAPARKG